jgi:anti-sigma B factor antagonist
MLERGNKRILLNFRKVRYLDSSGLGELVKTHVTVQRQGAQLKMSNLDQRLPNLLKATSLYKVFDVYEDEDTAVQSFGRLASVANAQATIRRVPSPSTAKAPCPDRDV